MVKSSADSLLSLLNDILDFSKIEAGKLDFETIDVQPARHAGRHDEDAQLRADQKGLELACHIPADVPDALLGDPARLRQILVNLVGNAIKFTERAARSWCRSLDEVGGTRRSGAGLSVTDTGSASLRRSSGRSSTPSRKPIARRRGRMAARVSG